MARIPIIKTGSRLGASELGVSLVPNRVGTFSATRRLLATGGAACLLRSTSRCRGSFFLWDPLCRAAQLRALRFRLSSLGLDLCSLFSQPFGSFAECHSPRCSLCQPQDAPGAAAAVPFTLQTCSVKARRDTYPKTSRCAPMSHRCASFFRFMRRAKTEAAFLRNCVDLRNRFPQKNTLLMLGMNVSLSHFQEHFQETSVFLFTGSSSSTDWLGQSLRKSLRWLTWTDCEPSLLF